MTGMYRTLALCQTISTFCVLVLPSHNSVMDLLLFTDEETEAQKRFELFAQPYYGQRVAKSGFELRLFGELSVSVDYY